MKNSFPSLLFVLIISSGCGTALPTTSLESSTLIKVECRNERVSQQIVLQLLRTNKARDIVIDNDGSFLNIQAAYNDTEVPRYKVEDVAKLLKQMPGVLKVEVEKNRSIVRQGF